MLEKLLDRLFELLSKPKELIDIFDNLSKRKQLTIERYAKEDIVNPKIKANAQEKLDTKAFRELTRINVDKFLMEKIIELRELAKGRLTEEDFRDALSHRFLKIDSNDELTIRRISFYDKFIHYYFLILGVSSAIVGCLLLMMIFIPISAPSELKIGVIETYSPSPDTSEFKIKLVFFLYGFFLLFLAFLLSLPTRPLKAAKKIEAEICQQLFKQERSNLRKINNLYSKNLLNLLKKNNLTFINHPFKKKNKR